MTKLDSQKSAADAAGTGARTQEKLVPFPIAPQKCRTYIRKEASKRWNVIVGNLLIKAEQGSVSHITLVAKLAGFEPGPVPVREPKRRTKSLAQQLREEMEALEARNIAEFGE